MSVLAKDIPQPVVAVFAAALIDSRTYLSYPARMIPAKFETFSAAVKERPSLLLWGSPPAAKSSPTPKKR